MTKPTCYIVTTDFDINMPSIAFDGEKRIWSPEQVMQYQKEKRGGIRSNDFLASYTADLERMAFERHLNKHGLKLYPCLNLRFRGIDLFFSDGFLYNFVVPDEALNNLVLSLVQLINPLDGETITHRKLDGRTHLDTVINYYSNEGRYDNAIKQLKDEFPVTEISICRERESILEEGYTYEELMERYK